MSNAAGRPSSCARTIADRRRFVTSVLHFDRNDDNDDSIYGTGIRGKILLAAGVALSIWFFSIPPVYRRTRLCGPEQSAAHPSRCMTPSQFAAGVADYYRGGGGIRWDFSVDPGIKEYYDNYGKQTVNLQ